MPPRATTIGAPAGPANRQATDTDSSVSPKCSLISPGTASTPSRTRLVPAATDSSPRSLRKVCLSLLIDSNAPKHSTGTRNELVHCTTRHRTPFAGVAELAHLPEHPSLEGSSAGV